MGVGVGVGVGVGFVTTWLVDPILGVKLAEPV